MQIDTERDPVIWCQSQITDYKTLIVQLVGFAATMLLGGLMIYFAFKVMKDRNQKITSIHIYIASWWIFMVIKTVLAITIYLVFIKNPIPHEKIETEMIWNGIFQITDNLVTFFLLTAMITIPCHWLIQILDRIQPDQNTVITGNSAQTTQQYYVQKERVFIDRCFSLLKFLKIYRKIRFLQIIFFFANGFVLIFADEETMKIFMLLRRILPISQSIIILALYAFGFYVLRRLQLILTHLPTWHFKRIILEYSILAFCSIVRAAYNLSFFLPIAIQYMPQENCLDQHVDQTIFRSAAIGIGLFFMHIIPAAVILNIYWQNEDQKSGNLRRNLLRVDQRQDY